MPTIGERAYPYHYTAVQLSAIQSLRSGLVVGGWYNPLQESKKDWWRCFHCGGANPNKDDNNKTVWKCQNCGAPKREDDKD